MSMHDAHDLLIVVGLTGVGKSTVLEDVLRARPSWRLLPNRRELTDRIILPEVQRHLGRPVEPVADRLDRFALTATYREMHTGGMTHALSMWLERAWLERAKRDDDGRATTLVFDNLRGRQEVEAAVAAFPRARYLLLDAAPATRLARLVERRDPFDRTAGGESHRARTGFKQCSETTSAQEHMRRLQGVSEAARVFDLEPVAAWAAHEAVEAADLERSARIIVEEQRNYDSAAARGYLANRLSEERFLAVDTDHLSPGEVVGRVLAWPGSAT